MPAAIAWSGFFGAWLLFAGPVFQAAVELGHEQRNQEELHETISSVPRPDAVSVWWWLLPPVAYLLIRHQSRRHRRAIFAALSHHQRAQVVSYLATAHGWLIVASGAFLIALKETWELCEHYEWPDEAFFGLIALAALAGVFHTAARLARGARMERLDDEAAAAASSAP